jgi:hypothetical protein
MHLRAQRGGQLQVRNHRVDFIGIVISGSSPAHESPFALREGTDDAVTCRTDLRVSPSFQLLFALQPSGFARRTASRGALQNHPRASGLCRPHRHFR